MVKVRNLIIIQSILFLVIFGFFFVSIKAEISEIKDSLNDFYDNSKFTEVSNKIADSVYMVIVKSSNQQPSFFTGSIYVDENNQMWGKGTAFALREDGYLLTARHVVKDAQEIYILNKDKNKIPANISTYSDALDTAILKVDIKLKPVDLIENGSIINAGSKVAFIGYPLGEDQIIHDGIISSVKTLGTDIYTYTINSFVNGGNSGGPVYLADSGQVIGVINAREFSNIPILIPKIDESKFSYEGKVLLQTQILMFQQLVLNSQMGIGYSMGVDERIYSLLK